MLKFDVKSNLESRTSVSPCVSKSVKFLIIILTFIKGKEPTKCLGGVDKRWEKLEMENLDSDYRGNHGY